MERVLVIDDELSVRELCRRALEAEGYQVKSVSNGRQAIELAKEEPFDLLLVDIRMPGLSGLETFQAIKKFSPDVTGVVITGYGSMEVAIEALHLGFSGFITKPFEIDELITAVGEALEKKRLDRENARLRALIPLFELGRTFMTTLDLDDLLKQVVRTVKQETGADAISLMLLDKDGRELDVRASLGPPQPGAKEFANWVLEKGRPLQLTDENSAEPRLKEVMERENISSVLAVPLTVKEKLIGVLNVSKSKGERPFAEGDLELISILGGQAAVAIENARLYQEIIRERERAKTLLEATFSGIIVVDLELRIITFNPGAEAITGYEADRVLGRPLPEVLGADICGEDSPLQEAINSGQQIAPVEVTITGRERKLDILLGITPLDDSYYLLSFVDITKLKEVDRLKSSIVANVSHEFRAPLASIKAYTELLLDGLDEGDRALRQEFLSVIDRETDRLTSLVNNFLDLARLEAGVEIKREPLLLREVVDDAISPLETQVREKEIALQIDVPSDLVLPADRELMVIIIKNLVSNAVKFSYRGGRVRIRGWEDESCLLFSVEDEGIGIPKEELPHLFEKFYRVYSTTESGIEGSGLGLVLVKEAVEAHGGRIEVESEFGVGSRFIVRLPKS